MFTAYITWSEKSRSLLHNMSNNGNIYDMIMNPDVDTANYPLVHISIASHSEYVSEHKYSYSIARILVMSQLCKKNKHES